MRDASELYRLTPEAENVPKGLRLVAGLTGFTDAGGAVGQFTEYLLGTIDHVAVAEFDVDVLLDYRARRPIIFFEEDHLTDYQPPALSLYLARDELGQPFLFLVGFEPDFRWDQFSRALIELVRHFEVSGTSWVHSIPMPVPHTRPIGVTVSGNREELTSAMSVWRPHTQVAANALHLVEYRLSEQGSEAVGFVLLVPHYLADTEYPASAISALECVSAATGLIFPTDRLREANREFVAKIDAQVAENGELAKLVGTLEERYDSYMAGTIMRSPLTDEDGELPSADEIAAELEKFLAFKRNTDGEPPLAR